MNVNQLVKDQVDRAAPGDLLALRDFPVRLARQVALLQALSHLYQLGVLRRIARGLYYKPQMSRFGELPPATSKVLKKLMEVYRDQIAYVSGVQAYTALKLTTQVSCEYVIASDRPRRFPLVLGATTFRFVPSYVRELVEDVRLLQILDAAREMDRIPATTPQEVSVLLMFRIKSLSAERQRELARLAAFYPPAVRAFSGLVLEQLGKKRLARGLAQTLNALSRYKISLDKEAFPNWRAWYVR